MDGSEDKKVRPSRSPLRTRTGYDVVWRRIVQAVGLVMAVAEFTDSRISRRPVDPNVLLLAATLIGIPLAARGGSEK